MRFPEAGETIEYRDRHSGRALLPAWQDFERYFVPHPVPSSRRREGFPETCDFLGMEYLWWVRAMDKEGTNAASRAYQRLMRRGIEAIHRCVDRGEDFDVTVDDGRPIRGYRHIVRVDDQE